MMAETGCDGVVVGRGCLGKPWLFGDLAAAFGEGIAPEPPSLGQVADAFRRHAELLVDFFGDDADGGEHRGCRDIRKHVAWYFKGYGVGGQLRSQLAQVESPRAPRRAARAARPRAALPGRGGGGAARPRRHAEVAVAAGPLARVAARSTTADRAAVAGAELDSSGG